MILKSEIQNLYINWLDEFHNMDINSALNIVQFVEIYFDFTHVGAEVFSVQKNFVTCSAFFGIEGGQYNRFIGFVDFLRGLIVAFTTGEIEESSQKID